MGYIQTHPTLTQVEHTGFHIVLHLTLQTINFEEL